MERIAYKAKRVMLRMAVLDLMPILDADLSVSGPFGNMELRSIVAVA
jgi:hypothetical protein